MRRHLLRTCVFLIAAVGTAAGAWADEVWVTNMKSGNVMVIDVSSNKVIATIDTCKGAHNVTISRDGKLAFVANVGASTVSIIDAEKKRVLGSVAAGKKAHDVSISPDGTRALASNVGEGTITLIDIAKRKALYTMATGKKAIMSVFSPDGRRAFVVNAGEATISVVDLDKRQVIKTLPGGTGSMAFILSSTIGYWTRAASVSLDWRQAWLTAPGENKLMQIDLEKAEVVGAIDVPGDAHGFVLSPAGSRGYVVQRKLHQVAIVDMVRRKIVKTEFVGERPDMLAISPDGKKLFVTSRDNDLLLVLDSADLSTIGEVKTNVEPHGVAYRVR